MHDYKVRDAHWRDWRGIVHFARDVCFDDDPEIQAETGVLTCERDEADNDDAYMGGFDTVDLPVTCIRCLALM